MALRFDLDGNPLPSLYPERIVKNIKNQSVTSRTANVMAPIERGTNVEIVALRAIVDGLVLRVDALETALRNAGQSKTSPISPKSSPISPKSSPISPKSSPISPKSSPTQSNLDKPWTALGISKSSYYSKKKAGHL